MDYQAEVILAVAEQRERLRGDRIVWQASVLRHFTARLAPIR